MTLQFISRDKWLADHRHFAPPDQALAFVDVSSPQPVENMFGRWRGNELPTGSALDGLLEALRLVRQGSATPRRCTRC